MCVNMSYRNYVLLNACAYITTGSERVLISELWLTTRCTYIQIPHTHTAANHAPKFSMRVTASACDSKTICTYK